MKKNTIESPSIEHVPVTETRAEEILDISKQPSICQTLRIRERQNIDQLDFFVQLQ